MARAKRVRENRIVFRVTPVEKELIEQRMLALGIRNREAYLRKIVINGYILHLDLKEIRSMSAQLSRLGSNLNQITKRVNSTGSLYKEDLADIHQQQEQISKDLRILLKKIEQFD